MLNIIPIPGFSEPFSSISHLLAAFSAFVGGFYLYKRGSGNLTRLFSLFVFSLALVFLFSMSGVYHLLEPGNTPRAVFQRMDHAAIWVLIAGTFTPIHTLLFRGIWRWGFLLAIWIIAITGLVLEVVFFNSVPEWLSLSFYLSLGWAGILSGWKYSRDYGFHGARIMVLGGLSYSVGAILEYSRWPTLVPGVIGPHEIFHVFIMIGASWFWYFVFERAGHPIISQLMVDVIERPNDDFIAKVRGEKIVVRSSSMDKLKALLKAEVEDRFPIHVRPNTMVLKHRREDLVTLRDE
ncbi:MAG: DNA-binding protein [Gammaproteobacteria bacterium]|nr:DNA-binding protein [Gammaproteobacteria bacterium]